MPSRLTKGSTPPDRRAALAGLGKSTFSSLAQIARAAGEVLMEQPVDLELAQRGEAGLARTRIDTHAAMPSPTTRVRCVRRSSVSMSVCGRRRAKTEL